NSLLEGLVIGALCGRKAGEAASAIPDRFVVPQVCAEFEPEDSGPRLDIDDLTSSLRSLMMRNMGIVRTIQGLEEANQQVAFWCRYVLKRELSTKAGWELQNMLTVARLMIWSAIQREESRGVHLRADFPIRNDKNWQRHLVCPPNFSDAK
ncbi:MAG: L-aspartate oxidase, partial [Gemmataceae bacterium]